MDTKSTDSPGDQSEDLINAAIIIIGYKSIKYVLQHSIEADDFEKTKMINKTRKLFRFYLIISHASFITSKTEKKLCFFYPHILEKQDLQA